MSAKFLPFISDNSGPEAIFKALITKSKGIASKKLSVIYSAVIVCGISRIRKSIPKEAESYSSIIEYIYETYSAYALSTDAIAFWKYVTINFEVTRIKNSNSYTFDELSVMVASIAMNKREKLIDIGFHWNAEELCVAADPSYDRNIGYFVNANLSEEHQRLGFTSIIELKAYLVCLPFIHTQKHKNFMPVLVTTDSDCFYTNYNENDCISPYIVQEDT